MVATVVKSCLYIDYWVTGDNTTLKCFTHTSFNWLAVFLRHNTTLDFVEELEALTSFVWFEANPYVTVLTTST
ncbi:hypothetical protein D3C85_1455420 [compost metagenome]